MIGTSVGFGELPLYPNTILLKVHSVIRKKNVMLLVTKNFALWERIILSKIASKNTRHLKIVFFLRQSGSQSNLLQSCLQQ